MQITFASSDATAMMSFRKLASKYCISVYQATKAPTVTWNKVLISFSEVIVTRRNWLSRASPPSVSWVEPNSFQFIIDTWRNQLKVRGFYSDLIKAMASTQIAFVRFVSKIHIKLRNVAHYKCFETTPADLEEVPLAFIKNSCSTTRN